MPRRFRKIARRDLQRLAMAKFDAVLELLGDCPPEVASVVATGLEQYADVAVMAGHGDRMTRVQKRAAFDRAYDLEEATEVERDAIIDRHVPPSLLDNARTRMARWVKVED